MKKAKLMLSALGIVAVLGSAFAFKASTYDNNVVYTGAVGSGICTTKTTFAAITGGNVNKAASTTPLTSHCPDARVITLDVNQ